MFCSANRVAVESNRARRLRDLKGPAPMRRGSRHAGLGSKGGLPVRRSSALRRAFPVFLLLTLTFGIQFSLLLAYEMLRPYGHDLWFAKDLRRSRHYARERAFEADAPR